MPFDLPQTPESPQYSTFTESSKQVPSPRAHSLLTPAHSINGSVSSIKLEMYQSEDSKKRKRETDDTGDQNLKKAHLETSRLHLEDLHLELGRKYKLCHTKIPSSTPDLTQDLLSLYGLENISKSVARTNPDGSKGVRLRKTYKNHIKDHQLSGNFDSVKRETDDPNTIYSMMTVPQDEWDSNNICMEDMKSGMPDTIKQLMGKAFKMSRGVIPKSSWNSSILGDLAPSATPIELSRPAHNTSKMTYQQTNSGALKSGKLVGPRPKRSVKKRTYGDSSFEGYGEGYIDEENREGDYVIGDGEGVSKKRHKKSSQNHNFQNASTRHNSYGPGMVGA